MYALAVFYRPNLTCMAWLPRYLEAIQVFEHICALQFKIKTFPKHALLFAHICHTKAIVISYLLRYCLTIYDPEVHIELA